MRRISSWRSGVWAWDFGFTTRQVPQSLHRYYAVAIASVPNDILTAILTAAMDVGFGNHGIGSTRWQYSFLQIYTKSCVFTPPPFFLATLEAILTEPVQEAFDQRYVKRPTMYCKQVNRALSYGTCCLIPSLFCSWIPASRWKPHLRISTASLPTNRTLSDLTGTSRERKFLIPSSYVFVSTQKRTCYS